MKRLPGATAFLAAGLAALVPAAIAQSPEEYFQGAGVGFRETAEEQKLYWQPHIARSYERILEAASLAAENGVVTVLGARVCTEIPLEELARRFERVVLVDLDGPSMLEAIEPLPLELRPKVELRVTDVTTFAAALMEDLQAAAEAAGSADDALNRFETILRDVKPGRIPVRLPPSDLVISSLVVSALDRYPLAYADRLLQTRFRRRLRSWDGVEQAARRLQEAAIEDHFRILRSICRPGGAIYFADTVARGPAYGRFSAELRKSVEGRIEPELRRLGLMKNAPSVSAAVGRMCRGESGVEPEIAGFEALLQAYEGAAPDAFESMIPVEAVRRQWESEGLRLVGAPESWWWLEYPCAIVHSPGGFRVTSWILGSSSAPDR